MANPWGANLGVGSSWADDEPNGQAPAPAAALFGNEEAFPTLGAAVAKGPSGKKGKKNKGVTMDLGTFQRQGVSRSSIGPDVNALRMTLPTAPTGGTRPEYGGHGRGYGGDGGGGFRDREHREERRPRREPEDLGPSKADEVDDWGRDKKHVPGSDRGGYGGAFGGRAGFRDRDGDERPPRRGGFDHSGSSRADDADDWGRKGGPPPSDERRDRGGFGGFRGRDFRDGHEGGPRDRDAHREPREYVPSKADEADSWGSGKKFQPAEQGSTFSGRRNSEREGRRSGFGFGAGADDGDKWSRKPQENPADAPAQPVGERKRLNLQPRSKPLGGAAEEAPRSSIFGAARPREQVLAEQGRDYRKEEMMLEHRAVDRKETEEERKLMAEIEVLRRRVVDGEADHPVDGVATSNTAYDALALAAEDPEGEGEGEGEAEGEEAAAAHAAHEEEEDAARGEAAGAITVKKLLEEKEAEFLRLQAQLDDTVRYMKERGRAKQQDEGQEGADDLRRESGGKGEDGGFREVAGRGPRGGEKAAQAENGRPGTGGEGRQSRAPPRKEDDGDRWLSLLSPQSRRIGPRRRPMLGTMERQFTGPKRGMDLQDTHPGLHRGD